MQIKSENVQKTLLSALICGRIKKMWKP